jgi:hypothetical protein
VNFFGHAVVATWQSDRAGFVLGAMLPDFATMLGTRPPAVEHTELADGVHFHHETDRVFHEAPTFRRLQLDARRTLREMGLPRPSALAVGHIGVEILLDTVLADDAGGVAGYLAALALAPGDALGRFIAWNDDALRPRFETLSSVLSERGVTASSRGPGAAALRVTRALASRPRLRLTDGGEAIVQTWAHLAAPIVAAAAGALVGEIQTGLAISHAAGPLG